MKRLGNVNRSTAMVLLLTVLATTLGCDDRAMTIAREAADRQAEQNRTMAELEHEVAAGARQLVEEEGQARRQALEIHRDLQAERGQLADAWSGLELERQNIARSRRTESFWMALVPAAGGALAAVLALAFAWIVLVGSRREDADAAACQLLLDEFIADADHIAAFPSSNGALPAMQARLLGGATAQSPLQKDIS
jgi:hypothetical protein